MKRFLFFPIAVALVLAFELRSHWGRQIPSVCKIKAGEPIHIAAWMVMQDQMPR